jgi:beta-glucosidase
MGYGSGVHAPGKKLSDEALAQCIHHALRAARNVTFALKEDWTFSHTWLFDAAVDGFGNKARKAPGFPRTALKWPVTPECLYFGPRFLYERYKLPVIITENGQSCNDRVFGDGAVHDPDRIDFLSQYLRELRRAAEDGIPVNGYFHWSLTDNFEWHSGYDERFGLVYVDYETQERMIKDSGRWYRNVIKNNGNEC